MKNWINLFLFFGIGAGVGFFAGERYGRKKAQEQQEATTVQETATAEEPAQEATTIEEKVKELGYVSSDGDEDGDDHLTDQIDDLNAYFAQYEYPQEEDPTADEEGDKQYEAVQAKAKPIGDYIFETDVEEWDTAEESYAKVPLTYYEEDEVVCDEDENRVEDAEDLIGMDILTKFGTNPVNPLDAVYVRNTWTETIYEITRIHNSYKRVVLGIDDDFDFYNPNN